jgi:hypothetical protein
MAALAMKMRRLALLLLILGWVLFLGEVRLRDSSAARYAPRWPLDVVPAKESRPYPPAKFTDPPMPPVPPGPTTWERDGRRR